MSDNGSGALHQMGEGTSMTAGWTIEQVRAFYAEMTRRLSAVMVLLDTIPLSEMKGVNERLQATGVLSLPADVTGDQARAWLTNLQRDHKLLGALQDVIKHVKGS